MERGGNAISETEEFDIVHEPQVLVVLCHRVFVRCRVLQRDWDLHFVDFIKVCLRPVKWASIERASNVTVFPDRSNDYSINDGIISDWIGAATEQGRRRKQRETDP